MPHTRKSHRIAVVEASGEVDLRDGSVPSVSWVDSDGTAAFSQMRAL